MKCHDPWEAAYLRFESAEEEIAKFTRRLNRLGAAEWSRDVEVVELFCGRGNGLHALAGLGFSQVEGVDLSATLLAQYRGVADCHVGDCRQLRFGDRSKDILIVQGGLHHLTTLPGDLERTLSEANRVLRDEGRLVIVEPWHTPFLALVHSLCRSATVRRVSSRFDALASMIHYERVTYEAWLSQPRVILDILDCHFTTARRSIAWGKLAYVGHPRRPPRAFESLPSQRRLSQGRPLGRRWMRGHWRASNAFRAFVSSTSASSGVAKTLAFSLSSRRRK